MTHSKMIYSFNIQHFHLKTILHPLRLSKPVWGPYLSFAWSRRFPLRAACNDPIDLQFFAEQLWRAADPSLRLEAFARVEALLKHGWNEEAWLTVGDN